MSVKIWDKTNGEALPLVTAKESDDIYSTTETKTNKVWIDGKPIYRKVVSGTVANIDTWEDYADLSSINIKSLINLYGAIGLDDGLTQINVPNEMFMTHYYPSTKILRAYSKWHNRTITLVLEYTKAD